MLPPSRQRPEDLHLWLWSAYPWWESWGDGDRPGEPVAFSFQAPLWTSSDLLHVRNPIRKPFDYLTKLIKTRYKSGWQHTYYIMDSLVYIIKHTVAHTMLLNVTFFWVLKKKKKSSNYHERVSDLQICYSWENRSGTNQWRDQLKPSQILQNLARVKGVSPPRSEDNGNTLTFNGQEYQLSDFGDLFLSSIIWFAKPTKAINSLIYFND